MRKIHEAIASRAGALIGSRHLAWLVTASMAVGAVACSSTTTTTPPSTSSTTTTLVTGFQGLSGRYAPGTAASTWTSIRQEPSAPSPATEEQYATSKDHTYSMAFFDFASASAATSFYDSPPPEIHGLAPGALGYATLNGPLAGSAPTRAVDLRSCQGEGSGASLEISGGCSNGSASFSIGVAELLDRGDVVVAVAYLPGNTISQAQPGELYDLSAYVGDCQILLLEVGLTQVHAVPKSL